MHYEYRINVIICAVLTAVLLSLSGCGRCVSPSPSPRDMVRPSAVIVSPTPKATEVPATPTPPTDPDILATDEFFFRVNEDGTATVMDSRRAYIDESPLVIPESIDGHTVTGIGEKAFQYRYFSAVELPGTLLSIGDWAFSDCDNLTEMYIPDSVTTIGEAAFLECDLLETVHLPEKLSSLGPRAFMECMALKEINLPRSLSELARGTFSYCESLRTVVLPDGLTRIDEFAFGYCNVLHTARLPDSLQYIGEKAFATCPAITDVNIPKSVTFLGNEAFLACGMESISIPKSVTEMTGNPFAGATLQEIDLSADNSCFTIIDGALFSKDGTKLICFPAGVEADHYDVPEGTVTIGAGAFLGSRLKSLRLPDTVEYIEGGAFSYSEYLENIELPESVKSIEGFAFDFCINLKSVKLPESLLEIENYVFSRCKGLEKVFIPAPVRRIGENTFDGCPELCLIVERGSYAEQYAIENEISYQYVEADSAA